MLQTFLRARKRGDDAGVKSDDCNSVDGERQRRESTRETFDPLHGVL